MGVLASLVEGLHAAAGALSAQERAPRTPEEQARVEREASGLALYHTPFCPFCIRVRRALRRLDLPLTLRDVSEDPEHAQALVEGGGQMQVPCLRIGGEAGADRWLYESADIIRYLEERFGT